MSVSILEALYNAEMNVSTAQKVPAMTRILLPLANEQLHNAITLLEKGYGLDDEVDPLLEEYGNVDDVPLKVES